MRFLAGVALMLLVAGQNFSPINQSCPTEVILGDGTCGGAPGGEAASIPANAILPFSAGPCPAGYTEWGDGKFMRGVTHASGNAGTTGGSDDITSVLDHTHTVNVNDPGHTHTLPAFAHATGSSANKVEVTNSSTGSSASANSNTTGITATTANPAGGVASIDNRPAHINVVFCQKQ